MCLFEKRFSHQHGAQEDCAGVMVEFVNLPRQSAGWRLRFAKFVLSSAALTAFIPKLSNGVWWKKAGKETICCRITDCAELEGAYTLRRLFFRVWLVILIPSSPSNGQLDILSSVPSTIPSCQPRAFFLFI